MRHHRLDFRQILFKTLTVVKVSGVIIRATCPKIYGQSFPPPTREFVKLLPERATDSIKSSTGVR